MLLASLRSYVSSPLLSKEYRRRVGEYLRPGFHPSDRDTDALVRRWREELFGPEGSLSSLVVGEVNGEPAVT